jgi:hypothetical protein
MRRGESVDAHLKPIPWYTYPAIEYLKQIDFSDKAVFEFGSGNSTLFWAQRCKTIVSVEDNVAWYDTIRPQCPSNVEYRLVTDPTAYATTILDFAVAFDVVILDGSSRFECAQAAIGKLSPFGMIILDNADRETDTASLLRSADLLEVDMTGFGPINGYPWTTSFFFTSGARPQPHNDRQPVNGIRTLSASRVQT